MVYPPFFSAIDIGRKKMKGIKKASWRSGIVNRHSPTPTMTGIASPSMPAYYAVQAGREQPGMPSAARWRWTLCRRKWYSSDEETVKRTDFG